jgi:hypothetical protein
MIEFIHKQINLQTWLVLCLAGLYGALMINFFTLMYEYLESRVTTDYKYQIDLIYKLFCIIFIIPRMIRICFCCDYTNQSNHNNNNNENNNNNNNNNNNSINKKLDYILGRKPFCLVIRQNLHLYAIITKLTLITVYQLSSSHFKDNLKFVTILKSVKLDLTTMLTFAFIYPILLGNLFPIIFNKLNELTNLTTNNNNNNNNHLTIKNLTFHLLILIWSMILFGGFVSLLVNNYMSKYLIVNQTTNVLFIYSNLVLILMFILVLIIYSIISYRKQQQTNNNTYYSQPTSFLHLNSNSSTTLAMFNTFSDLKQNDELND